MKVVCVSNKGYDRLPLTIGKMYDVIEKVNIPFSPQRINDPSDFYRIICDNGQEKHIDSDRFRQLTLKEKRELKLEDLGI